VIPAQAEFNRVAQRSSANNLYVRTVAETHLQEPTADIRLTAYRKDAPAAADTQLVQTASLGTATMITSGKRTSLLHIHHSIGRATRTLAHPKVRESEPADYLSEYIIYKTIVSTFRNPPSGTNLARIFAQRQISVPANLRPWDRTPVYPPIGRRLRRSGKPFVALEMSIPLSGHRRFDSPHTALMMRL
jgi:hypothetical protein